MSGRHTKSLVGLFCSIPAGFVVWFETTIWTRWKVALFILTLLGLNGRCQANAAPTTNAPTEPPTIANVNGTVDLYQVQKMIETMSATNKTFKLAVGYITAEMMGHTPPKLPEGVTQGDLSNAAFQMFIIPRLAITQKIIEFYGKAIDESNQPIEGAKIEFAWIHFFPPPEGEIRTNIISDQQGQFSLSGVTGVSLNVHASKDGYYDMASLNRTNFAYSTSLNSIPFQPDSNNPVIFHLHRDSQGHAVHAESH
jgi:hypothetical protein